MRTLAMVIVIVIVAFSGSARAQSTKLDDGRSPATSIRSDTRRAMLGYGALGMTAALGISVGIACAAAWGIPERGREDPTPVFTGIGLGLTTALVGGPTLLAWGLEHGGRRQGLRGGIGPAWGAAFATLAAGGLLTSGLLMTPSLESRAARSIVVTLPLASAAGAVGFAYLAYRRRDRLVRERDARRVQTFFAPSVARHHLALVAGARF